MRNKAIATSYPKEKIRILLLENIHASAAEVFRQHGYTSVTGMKQALEEDELLKHAAGIHLLGIRSKTRLSKTFFEKSPKFIAAACFCIGTNQVNMESATANGVAVFNSPYSNTRSVAELVIAHCIWLMRGITDKNNAAHRGEWKKETKNSHEVRGKTIGIIGYGHIGSQVSVMAEGLGMHVLFYDIIPRLALGNAQPVKSTEELCRRSDVVTLHVPSSASTRNMVNEIFLRKMKKGAMLINLSRGDVVDLTALRDAIISGQTGGAALDVFPAEPDSNLQPFKTPVQGLPNVILTPHIGGSTEEAQQQIGTDAAMRMVQYLESGNSTGSLSVPELSLPLQHEAHRLLHIHRNVPGVLGDINGTLSSMKMNILGQYLKTNERIGYVVFDVDKKHTRSIVDDLKKIKHTIKVRSLY